MRGGRYRKKRDRPSLLWCPSLQSDKEEARLVTTRFAGCNFRDGMRQLTELTDGIPVLFMSVQRRLYRATLSASQYHGTERCLPKSRRSQFIRTTLGKKNCSFPIVICDDFSEFLFGFCYAQWTAYYCNNCGCAASHLKLSEMLSACLTPLIPA